MVQFTLLSAQPVANLDEAHVYNASIRVTLIYTYILIILTFSTAYTKAHSSSESYNLNVGPAYLAVNGSLVHRTGHL
jgi:hypothetical protein